MLAAVLEPASAGVMSQKFSQELQVAHALAIRLQVQLR